MSETCLRQGGCCDVMVDAPSSGIRLVAVLPKAADGSIPVVDVTMDLWHPDHEGMPVSAEMMEEFWRAVRRKGCQ